MVNVLNGDLLANITHQTETLSLLLAGNHRVQISFHVMLSSHAPLVLGLPWLQEPNPVIDWAAGRITSWSSFCHTSCLKSALPPCSSKPSAAPPEPPDISSVPPVYQVLAYHLTDLSTAPLSCCLEPRFPGFTSSPLLNEKAWRPT